MACDVHARLFRATATPPRVLDTPLPNHSLAACKTPKATQRPSRRCKRWRQKRFSCTTGRAVGCSLRRSWELFMGMLRARGSCSSLGSTSIRTRLTSRKEDFDHRNQCFLTKTGALNSTLDAALPPLDAVDTILMQRGRDCGTSSYT